ncbi:hypothetical protein ACFRJ1_21955 [Streptomyces sp. NPDC056773]|uniref:DUF7373 family lipoprotein n=1 Tax=unclassified Streptomyces TaxID=2593676 RepID=UPI003682BA2A
MAVLTGCGGDEDAANSPVGVAPIGSGDGKGKKSGPLTVEQVRAALPTNEVLGDVFVGDDLAAFDGEMARQHCAEQTGTPCTGLVAAGHKEAAVRGNSDDDEVEFTLFSFDSKQAATDAMKGMAAKEASGDPAPEPTQFTTGADETQAFTNGMSSTRTFMRVGTVVAFVQASIYNTENRDRMSSLQVELIKKAG